MTDDSRSTKDARTPLERLLGLFAEVRVGEGRAVLGLALNVFLLLFAYYLIKTVREALILSEEGAEQKVYLQAVVSVLLVLYAKAFGALARRMNRFRLISVVTLFFASNLVLFYLLGRAGFDLGIPFFVWVSIFNVSIIAQFWSFANDLYTEEQGERLFAIVAGGSTLGAVAGSYGASLVYDRLGSYNLMLVTGGLLVLSLALTFALHRRQGVVADGDRPNAEGSPEATDASDDARTSVVGGARGAFQLVFKDRYLLLVGAITLLGTWVNTMGGYIFDQALLTEARQVVGDGESVERFIGEFKGRFFTAVNITVVVLQFFAVSRILKYLGVRVALFILPVIALGGYTSMMIAPVLAVIFVAKVAENGTDYSLQNTVRQTLFLVTSREAKYKAKALIDTFFFRVGDTMAAAMVLLGSLLAVGTRTFIAVIMVLLAVWVGVAVATVRAHRRRAREHREALQGAGEKAEPS